MPHPTPEAVLDFWFEEIAPALWWQADPDFDALIRTRFDALHRAAAAAELWAWRARPAGRLAEVIVLDQFSRNLHRGTALAFACDPMALALAQEAVVAGQDLKLPLAHRHFLYMPYMHSESPRIHLEAERLFSAPGLEDALRSERAHKAIIDRFGRYPHRNMALGRDATAEERAFLREPGSSF